MSCDCIVIQRRVVTWSCKGVRRKLELKEAALPTAWRQWVGPVAVQVGGLSQSSAREEGTWQIRKDLVIFYFVCSNSGIMNYVWTKKPLEMCMKYNPVLWVGVLVGQIMEHSRILMVKTHLRILVWFLFATLCFSGLYESSATELAYLEHGT